MPIMCKRFVWTELSGGNDSQSLPYFQYGYSLDSKRAWDSCAVHQHNTKERLIRPCDSCNLDVHRNGVGSCTMTLVVYWLVGDNLALEKKWKIISILFDVCAMWWEIMVIVSGAKPTRVSYTNKQCNPWINRNKKKITTQCINEMGHKST